MERMGHSTTRAALTYLHASDERQRAIAEAISKISAGELGRRGPVPSGTQRTRKRRNASYRSSELSPASGPRPERDSNARPTA